MRLWSIHPENLDAKGLVALWREALLAQKVLAGKTKGYRNHPQLHRFKKTRDPLAYIGFYLDCVVQEALTRNYNFDRTKILKLSRRKLKMRVTHMQLRYEIDHLFKKLKRRDRKKFLEVSKKKVRTHPMFRPVPGPTEPWEKTKTT